MLFLSGCTNLCSHQQDTSVLFSLYLPNTYCFCLFEESHSDRCEMAPHYGLDLHVTGGEW